eukprot:TRINITY_DN11009_c0_g1_i1.p1 TRINITY_DN11009_c0_g1~~TRINITY_DN11009_c0_g1_i1.p1  ORF type:complete len:607 (-),score=115.28 TRINITY_DN11009_c0_g1_i1:35-1855(-)
MDDGVCRNQHARMVEHEKRLDRFRTEEKAEAIEALKQEGNMTNDQAQARLARMKMHQKSEQEGGNQIRGIAAASANFQTTEQILEDILDYQSHSPLIRFFKKSLGIDWIDKMYQLEMLNRKEPGWVHPFPAIHKIVDSASFEKVFGLLMMLNGMTIGIEASLKEDDDDSKLVAKVTEISEHVFACGFILEITLRMADEGWVWLWNFLNACDLSLIIFTGVLPLWVLKPLGVENESVRVVQILRVVRLIRLVRMVRTVRLFRTFWRLIRGVLDSGRTLLWTYILMGSVLYIFALFAVQWIGKADALVDDPIAQEYFGDVVKAMLTLFQVTTLDNWAAVARPLIKKAPDDAARIFSVFIAVIMICTLVMLNLVTAVIVNTSFQRAAQDDELNARAKRESIDKEIQDLRNIFNEIDEDGNGTLSKGEYDRALLYNDQIKQKFEILQLNAGDQEEIWKLIDTGQDVFVDEFANTLRALQGDAKAKDSFAIVKRVQHLNVRLEKLTKTLAQYREFAELVRAECEVVHRKHGAALNEVVEFLQFAGYCLPPSPAPRPVKELTDLKMNLQRRVDELEARAAERMRSSFSPTLSDGFSETSPFSLDDGSVQELS